MLMIGVNSSKVRCKYHVLGSQIVEKFRKIKKNWYHLILISYTLSDKLHPN